MLPDCLRAAHRPACTVGAGLERIRVAETLDYIGADPLRTRDDAELSLTGASGSLAVDDYVLIEVVLPYRIVVRNIDHRSNRASG